MPHFVQNATYTFSFSVCLGSSWLPQFLSLSLFLMADLRSIDQGICKMLLHGHLFDFFSHDFTGVMGVWEEDHRGEKCRFHHTVTRTRPCWCWAWSLFCGAVRFLHRDATVFSSLSILYSYLKSREFCSSSSLRVEYLQKLLIH